MKYLTGFLCFLMIFSCSSLKYVNESPSCPEAYQCNTVLLKNTSIKILEDSIGKKYINLEQSADCHTVKYTYSYEGKPEIADDSYSEEIYFQIPIDTKSLYLSDSELYDVKLITSKNCFCKDAGFEVVNQGSFEFKRKGKHYYVNLEILSSRDIRVKSLSTKVSL